MNILLPIVEASNDLKMALKFKESCKKKKKKNLSKRTKPAFWPSYFAQLHQARSIEHEKSI